MESEGARLASFGLYPSDQTEGTFSRNPYLSPIRLAQAGFCRREGLRRDAVECYSCGLCVVNWGRQSPLTVHRVLCPNCKHLRELYNTPVRPALSLPGSSAADSATLQSVRRRLFGEAGNPAGSGILDILDSGVANGLVVEDTLMFYESHRLMTFANPFDSISKAWAKEGFIMQIIMDENENDVIVMCVFCGKKGSFEAGTPVEVHRKISPGCPLLRRVDVGNVTMEDEVEIKRMHGELDGGSTNDGRLHRYPQFQDLAKRLETFCKWSKLMQKILPKETLAEAGFFYTGCADCVQCFSCGVNLRNWEPSDDGIDIWKQHARVQPTCLFLQVQRDQTFVSACASIQLECEFDPPKEGPLMVQGDLRTPSCLERGLPLEVVQAALDSGYKIGLIRQALRFVFLASPGYWPNWPLLLGKLQSFEANSKLLHQKDSRMLDMAQEVQQYQQEVQQRDIQVEQYQQEVQQYQQEVQQRDIQVQQYQQEVQQRDIQVQQYQQEVQQKDAQCQQKDELYQQQLQQKYTQLQRMQELQELNQQLLQTLENSQALLQQKENLQRELQKNSGHKLSVISRQRQELVSKDKELVSKDKELVKNRQELVSKDKKLAKLRSLLQEMGAELPDLDDSEGEEAAASPEPVQPELAEPQQPAGDANQGQDLTPAGDLEELSDPQSADPNDLEPADSLESNPDPAASEDSEANGFPELIQCHVCRQEEACALFLPCRHLGCGIVCADRIDREGRPCPFCRSPFEEWIQVFRA